MFEMICAILLKIDKKKDHKLWLDLKDVGIRPKLHPLEMENGASSLP
jgi:hypothetical protein